MEGEIFHPDQRPPPVLQEGDQQDHRDGRLHIQGETRPRQREREVGCLHISQFQIKLSEVDGIELLDKRGYLTICISLQREGKFYLRRADGIRDWFEAIRDNMKESRARKNNRNSAIFLDRRQNTDSSGMENWLAQRRIGKLGLSDSTPEVNKAGVKDGKDKITLDELSNLYRNEEMEQEETRRKEEEVKTKLTKKINRLSCK